MGDMFQHKIDEIFNDMPNVFGTTDDIFVIGYDKEEQTMMQQSTKCWVGVGRST